MNEADERILQLVKPAYMECIPSFVRWHATKCLCQQIAREYPELYADFAGEIEVDEATKRRMAEVVNALMLTRMQKRLPHC